MLPVCIPIVLRCFRPSTTPSSPSIFLHSLKCLSLPPETSSSGPLRSGSSGTHSRQFTDTPRSVEAQIFSPAMTTKSRYKVNFINLCWSFTTWSILMNYLNHSSLFFIKTKFYFLLNSFKRLFYSNFLFSQITLENNLK